MHARSNRRGSEASAIAISSRRRSPCESAPAASDARAASPTVSSSLRTCAWASSNASTLRRGSSARPARASTGTATFSSTESSGNTFVIWNVRAIPTRTRALGGSRVTSAPAKTTLPSSGTSFPLRRLMKVVLPAPLGPITAVMPPSGKARSIPATAVKSSNDFRNPRTSRTALMSAASASSAGWRRRQARRGTRAPSRGARARRRGASTR